MLLSNTDTYFRAIINTNRTSFRKILARPLSYVVLVALFVRKTESDHNRIIRILTSYRPNSDNRG